MNKSNQICIYMYVVFIHTWGGEEGEKVFMYLRTQHCSDINFPQTYMQIQ